ncbi:MAG: PH domain-containing protein [Rhodospirillales bacterium]|jgi:uncharacterized membrane protein YdbT with pleckstrin-like domain
MGYVQNTLGNGETIEFEIKFHWLYKVTAWLALIILGVFVIGVIIFFSMMIRKWTTERVLTNLRFIKKTGWIRRNTEEIPIDRMEEVNLNQTIFGRIFGYGNVTISGMGIGKINLKMIDDPLDFQRKLNDLKANLSMQA